jgi:hypothetical protein
MNIFLMVLTCLNIILVLGLSFTVFLKVKEKKEDQRITKGLQLLQHKIAILQDLSDKADEQAQRLVHMLDTKSNELRRATNEATVTITNIQNQVLANQALAASAPTPAQAGAQTTNTLSPLNMDEFNQFVQALNLQNEKVKPVIAAQNNFPQDFVVSNSETTQAVAEPISNIRPFEFKRVIK